MLTDALYIAFGNFMGYFWANSYHIRRYIVVFPKYLYLCVYFNGILLELIRCDKR